MRKQKQTQDSPGSPHSIKGLHSEEHEKQVIATLIVESDLIEKAQKELGTAGSEAFYNETLKGIYETLLGMKEQGIPINTTNLNDELRKQGKQILGSFLADVVNSLERGFELDYAIKKLRDLHTRRECRTGVTEFNQALDNGKDLIKAKQKLEERLGKLEATEETKEIGMAMSKTLSTPRKKQPLPIEGGLVSPGRWTIIGGEDGIGKTSFYLQLAGCASVGATFLERFPIKNPIQVLYFCGENIDEDMEEKMRMQLPELEKLKGENVGKYLDNLIMVYPDQVGYLQLDKKEGRAVLEEALRKYKPTIVFFDPLTYFIASSKSISDDTVAREVGTALNEIGRRYNCFNFVATHFKKPDEKGQGQIATWDKFHGSKYWMNLAVNQIAIYRANVKRYAQEKTIEFKFKTARTPPKILTELDRDTLWFEEKSQEEMSKATLGPKSVLDILVRVFQGKAVPSIFDEVAAEELDCTQKQIGELRKAATTNGLIEKKKGFLYPLKIERRGKGRPVKEKELFKEKK